MKPTTFLKLSALLIPLVLLPAVAHAQADHLRCFKTKDEAKFDATATLSALQSQFGINESCEIKGKAKLFCVPVTKNVTSFEDKSKQGIPQVSFSGQELTDDRVCYKIKCPKVEIGPEVVTDQFGTRTLQKFKSQLLCTPAFKGAPPTTCDPVAQDCLSGEACYADEGTCPAGTCSGLVGNGLQGSACSVDNDCAAGYGCVDVGGVLQCLQYCTTVGDCNTVVTIGCLSVCTGLGFCF